MSDPKVEKQKPVPPFVQFCCAAVPMVFDDSLSYYEALCAMWKYLDETVKVINNNALVTEDYIAKFEELKYYVDHYFDNLDVQEEINNKLDEMVTSGELQNIIAEFFSSIQAEVDAQNTEIANFKSDISSDISIQDGKINTLETRMDSFTNLTEGSTTGDAELIDGRISFTGRVSANIGDNIRSYQGLNFVDITDTLTKVEDHVVPISLTPAENASFDYWTLESEKGAIYFADVTGLNNIQQVQIGYDFVNSIPGNNTGYHDKPCIFIGTGGTIYINNLTETMTTPFIGKLDTKISEVNGYTDISASLTLHSGKYIKVDGSEGSSSSGEYYSFTPKKGHKYLIFNTLMDGVYPLVYQQNGNIYPDNSGNYTYGCPQLREYYCVNNSTVYINNRPSRLPGNVIVLESNSIYSTSDEKLDIEPLVGLFNKAIFCGDSLTYGQTYISNTAPVSYRNNVNYPKTLQKLAQIDSITELARSGATTTTWWNQFSDQITEENAVYFVWLGTNDTFTDTVATDCAGDDWTQYASTETGDFGRILGKIKSLTGTKIVLINTFAPAPKVTTNNKVIDDLATKFGATVINVNNAEVQKSGYHTAYNNYYNAVHFNNQGYTLIANMVFNQLNNYLNNNPGSYEIRSVHD